MADKPPEEPANLYEWLWRLKTYESSIYVRVQVDGHWKPIALADCNPEQWAVHMATWLQEGAVPVRVL